MDETTKPCGMCRAVLPLDAFNVMRAARTGRQNRCKVCVRAWQVTNAETVQAYAAKSYDMHKDRVKARSATRNAADPAARAAESAARYQRDIVRRKAQIAAWNAANPEKRRAISNSRRARVFNGQVVGPVPSAVYAAIRSAPECVYCGGPVQHVDHVRPLARGGWEHESNLVPSCQPCNAGKCARLLTEWDPIRVARARVASEKVAAEWARLTAA